MQAMRLEGTLQVREFVSNASWQDEVDTSFRTKRFSRGGVSGARVLGQLQRYWRTYYVAAMLIRGRKRMK